MATEKWNDLRLSNLWNSVAARKGGFRLAQIGGISTEFTWKSESVWNHKNYCGNGRTVSRKHSDFFRNSGISI